MKLKYYLRGLGVGILVTTVILMIASFGKRKSLSDVEIVERARELGMVMAEEVVKAPDRDTADDQVMEGVGIDNPAEGTEGQPPDDAAPDDQTPEEESVENPEGTPPPVTEAPIPIEIVDGDVSRTVSDKLLSAGLIADSEDFNRYLSESGRDGLLAVGIHEIPVGASYEEIAEVLCQTPES